MPASYRHSISISILGAVLFFISATESTASLGDLVHTFSNGEHASEMGFAISGADRDVLVGAPFASSQGRVYLFDGTAGGQLQLHSFTNGDVNSRFGQDVAGSASFVVVGAPFAQMTSGSDGGRIYIYDKASGALLHTLENGLANSKFGEAVAIADDRVLVGANSANSTGEAYLYDATSGALLRTFTNGDASSSFGEDVAFVGNRVLVGAPFANPSGPTEGRAYLYAADTGALLQTFTTADTGSQFGYAVAGVGGDKVLVGAPFADPSGAEEGRAYLYDANTGALLFSYGNGDTASRFGWSVAGVGDNVLVGSPFAESGGSEEGRAYFFSGKNGSLYYTFVNADTNSLFGWSVADVGDDILVGSPFAESSGNVHGRAYHYDGKFFADVSGVAGVTGNTNSRGVAWGDYDSDGDLDLYVANAAGTANNLFRNDGDTSFSDEGIATGTGDNGDGVGTIWGDYDNDGDLDLYLSNQGVNRLYRNNGNAYFDEVGFTAGVDDNSDNSGAGWADYDSDGDLDLYVASQSSTSKLFRNDGGTSFADVGGAPLNVAVTGINTGIGWGDYDNDGDPDLYIARDNLNNLLFRNDGGTSFADVSVSANVNNGSQGRGVAWGDVDNDGDLDFYLTNVGTNVLYHNNGNGTFTVENSDTGTSFGVGMADYNNDGNLDIYFANWGVNRLMHNNGNGTFSLVEGPTRVADSGNGFGVAWGDYDSDGDLDIYIGNFGSQNVLYDNSGGGNNWLRVELEGTVSNRSGIGALITATTGLTTQRRDVDGGSSIYSQPSLPIEFGFGSTAVIDALTVTWPSGIVQILNNVATNQVLSLIEVSTIDVSIPDLTSPYAQQVIVPVQLSETSGTGIVSAEIFLCYDGDLLTPLSTDLTGTLAASGWSIQSNIEEGGPIDTYKIAMATDDDVLFGAGTLVNITFQVADVRVPSTSALQLKHVLFNDGTPPNLATDGSLTILGTDGTIASLPATIIPRETVTVTVLDADLDTDGNPGTNTVVVTITNTNNTDTINLTLNEDGAIAGTFSSTYDTEYGAAATTGDLLIQADAGDPIVATYADALDGAGAGPTNRTATTNVIGGADGSVEITIVSQPGDPLYIQVTDADLNTNTGSAQTASVTVENNTTNDVFIVVLTEADDNDEVFFGSLPTTTGASTGTELGTAEDDLVTVTYDDVVTTVGDQQDRTDVNDVIFPWGDADDNDVLQAFDAAKILVHVLNSSPIDEQASNVDIQPITSQINPFDASLVLQKRVGLIATFPVQDPASENHPQGTPASPKLVPQTLSLSLVAGEGYLSVHAIERGDLLSGDLTIEGISGRIEMGTELANYLSASRTTNDGIRIVFAGAEPTTGPGELFRIYGMAPGTIELTDAVFNNGNITGTASSLTSMVTPTTFALHPNVPNPFNPETTLRFELPHAAEVKLEIFDAIGQKVRTLVSGALQAGTHSAIWHGRSDAGVQVGNGVYFYRIEADEFTQMRRMLLLK